MLGLAVYLANNCKQYSSFITYTLEEIVERPR